MKKFVSLLVAVALIATSASNQCSYTADAANSKVVSVGAKSKKAFNKAIEATKSKTKAVGEFLKEHKKAIGLGTVATTVAGEVSWNAYNIVKHYDEIAKIVFDGNLSVKEKIAKVSKVIFCGVPKTDKEKAKAAEEARKAEEAEAKRLAKEEADRLAKEEADRLAKAEAAKAQKLEENLKKK